MPEVLPSTLEPMVPPLEPAATASSDDEAMDSKASSTSSSTDDDTSSSSSEAEEADCLAVEPVLECACSADLPHRQSEYKGWTTSYRLKAPDQIDTKKLLKQLTTQQKKFMPLQTQLQSSVRAARPRPDHIEEFMEARTKRLLKQKRESYEK